MRRAWIIAALLLPLPLAADQPAGEPGGHFDEIDANGDGLISRGEAQTHAPRLAERFTTLDTDQDGSLSRAELAERARERSAAMRDRMDEKFKAADTDGDGQLSAEETKQGMPRIASNFADFDANGDGFLSREEIGSRMRGKHAQR